MANMIEQSLLCKVLDALDLEILHSNGVIEEMFLTCKDEIHFIIEHYNSYKQMPDKLTFLSKFKDFQMLEVTESTDYLVYKLKEAYTYNFQKKYKDKYCVYLDAENTIDKEWGETLGVDWSKVILIQPESEYGEKLLDMLLDYIRSGKIGLAVLDSAPFIIPKAVQEKGLDEKSYGGNSALMKAFCDKVVPLCKKVECTFLLINQLRENIGNPYKPFKIPCGTAIAHACSQILWFTKGSLLDEKYKEVSSGYSNPSGNLVSVKVEKNKVTKNDRRLQTYTLNYSTGVDEIKDTLDLAIMLGIISQAGAWFKATLKDGKEQKMQGFNGVQEFYYNDLEELEYLRKQVYEAGMV